MRIAVIGTGYLGTTHAACMAHIGHNVLGVDIDPGKVAKLQSGEVPFYEPDVETIVRDIWRPGASVLPTPTRKRQISRTCTFLR